MTYLIYTKPNCDFCKLAKGLLKSKNLDFVERNLDSPAAVNKFKTEFPTLKTVPQIFDYDSGKHIGGFKELQDALD